MIGYVKRFDNNKTISFKVNDEGTMSYKFKYYPQTLLEFKYEIKKAKMENLIDDGLYLSSSDDETDNESDNQIEFDYDE